MIRNYLHHNFPFVFEHHPTGTAWGTSLHSTLNHITADMLTNEYLGWQFKWKG